MRWLLVFLAGLLVGQLEPRIDWAGQDLQVAQVIDEAMHTADRIRKLKHR